MAITGTFHRSIDDKLRLPVPRPLREAFPVAEGDDLYLAPWNEGCIAVYSTDGFEKFAERLAAASPGGADVRTFHRLFYSRAERVVLDRQSRIRIPERLLGQVPENRDVVILGVNDHAEIWARDAWDAYMEKNLSLFDELPPC